MRKITVTEALKKLKLYDDKIYKAIGRAEFVGAAKKNSDLIGHKKKSTYENDAQSSFDSITAMIDNRDALKSAIVNSNAITKVEIGGITMTVAAAIEKKSSIEYDKRFLYAMKEQFDSAVSTVARENAKVDAQCDRLIETQLSGDNKTKIDKVDIEAFTAPYRKQREFAIVDPLDIEKKIAELESRIDAFEAEVDTKLNVSNALTTIEIDF